MLVAGDRLGLAAIVGLLFVAVSINAERIVGPHAMPERQGVATSTLTALANGLVISSWLLIPGHGAGPVFRVRLVS